MRVLGAVVVALFAMTLAFVWVLRHPVYTPDGIVYARFAARDAGYSERDATLAARAFYDRTQMMSNPRYRALIELDPSVSFARSKVFANRLLYPWVVGMALGAAGFRALFLVNAGAYVAFGLALFWMLCAFKRPALALALTLVALALPQIRAAAASDLTDMLAMVWWALALGALLRLSRRTRNTDAVVLAISGALLALTRPTPYLVVLPALVIGVARSSWVPLAASLGSVAAFGAGAIATHAYGISEQLHWVYDHRPNAASGISFSQWYRDALVSSIRFVAVQTVRTVVPLVMIAAAIYGLRRSATRIEMAVLAAAGIACLAAVPFNPVPSSFARVLLLPLVPVFCAITQCVVEALLVKPAPAAFERAEGARSAVAAD
ncbi:MAG TPA: hypothetical protein VJP85_03140 [Candidatus Baltobacteraceae bacterium]|nr:hypothetical protein [Candidatus Baltobacteraceae bacterium]